MRNGILLTTALQNGNLCSTFAAKLDGNTKPMPV